MVVIAVFALFLILYSALCPTMIRSTAQSSSYIQASALARHKIEQIRQAGYTHLNGTDFAVLGITDSATADASGSFSFTTVDRLVNTGTLVGYFGASTNATGTITVSRALSSQGTAAPPLTEAKQVTITIRWTGGGTSNGNYTTQTVLAAP